MDSLKSSTKGTTVVICKICHRVLCIERNDFTTMFFVGASEFHWHWDRRKDHPMYTDTLAKDLWIHIPVLQ